MKIQKQKNKEVCECKRKKLLQFFKRVIFSSTNLGHIKSIIRFLLAERREDAVLYQRIREGRKRMEMQALYCGYLRDERFL